MLINRIVEFKIIRQKFKTRLVKMVDTSDLKSDSFKSIGSSPIMSKL